TYNSGDSLVVTHLTTSPPVEGLTCGEQTGSGALLRLWSYVKENRKFNAQEHLVPCDIRKPASTWDDDGVTIYRLIRATVALYNFLVVSMPLRRLTFDLMDPVLPTSARNMNGIPDFTQAANYIIFAKKCIDYVEYAPF
ncbi:hypothetical protein BDW02DRAFT_506972, partial [Decorospora gaudefroyi]